MPVEGEGSLSTRAVRGVLWTASPFLVQWFVLVMFYALVPAEEMGVFEFALILVMFLALLADLGLGSALVQYEEVTEAHFHTAFWTNLIVGLSLTVIVVALAPSFAALQAESERDFTRVLSVLVLLVPLAAVSGIFRARLQRELSFRPMAVAEVVAIAAFCVSAVALVWAHGVMGAVISSVIRELALLVALCWASAWRPRLVFSTSALRQILGFGLNLTGSRCLNYFTNRLPALAIELRLGPSALAYYSFGYRLTLIPLARMSTVVMRVFFPTFSAVQRDDAVLRRGYLRTAQSIALFYWPLLTVFVFAPDLLEVLRRVDGHDLSAAATPLRLLAGAALLKAVGAAVGSIFLAKGKASWLLYWSLFSLALLLPALYLFLPHGVTGVAAAIAATAFVFLVLSQCLTNRLIGLDFTAFVSTLARPALVTVVVLAALVSTRQFIEADALTMCLLGAAVWAASTALGLRLFAWTLCVDLWRTARGDVACSRCR